MRAIITGGGTGGHIYPALAIADEIRKREPDSDILYLGNRVGLEKDIVPDYGYPMELVPAMWIDRSNPAMIVRTFVTTARGIAKAGFIMKKFRPDVVIGTGGYVCFPVIFAGHRYGANCFIHEQNAFPGVANRSLERYVDKVFLGFSEASEYFKDEDKLVVTGNPVRDEFSTVDKGEARKKLGIPEDDFVIFSFGGSLGAEIINECVYALCRKVRGRRNLRIIFGTGSRYYDEIMERAAADGLDKGPGIEIKPYISDMPEHLSAADLVICRCGALSVAEVCTCGRASVMIPSPNVTGNHQYYNAKSVADAGGSVLIEEKDLTEELLCSEVLRLAEDVSLTGEMGRISRTCVPGNATTKIYEEIKEVLERTNR